MAKKRKNVLLLIEDNPLLTGLYKSAFEQRDVTVFVAHDGKSGLELVKEHKPEVILLDLLMPGIDGFNVLRDLKRNSATKDIKVVVLTVLSGKKEQERVEKLGAADYLIKQDLQLNEIVERILKLFPR